MRIEVIVATTAWIMQLGTLTAAEEQVTASEKPMPSTRASITEPWDERAHVSFANERSYSLRKLKEEAIRVMEDPYGRKVDGSYECAVYVLLAGTNTACGVLFTRGKEQFQLLEFRPDLGVSGVMCGPPRNVICPTNLAAHARSLSIDAYCHFAPANGQVGEPGMTLLGRTLVKECLPMPENGGTQGWRNLQEMRELCSKAIKALGERLDETWRCSIAFSLGNGECVAHFSSGNRWYEAVLESSGAVSRVIGVLGVGGPWWEQLYQNGWPTGPRRTHMKNETRGPSA